MDKMYVGPAGRIAHDRKLNGTHISDSAALSLTPRPVHTLSTATMITPHRPQIQYLFRPV